MLSIARRVAILDPMVLTALWFLGAFWPIFLLDPSYRQIMMVLGMITLTVPLCGWAWSVYAISTCRNDDAASYYSLTWVFVLPVFIAVGAALLGLPTHNSPASALFFLTLFFALWRAAQALERVSAGEAKADTGRIFKTMMLMFFMGIGVWVLRPKILQAVGSEA